MKKKELKHLNFSNLIDYFSKFCKKIPDSRSKKKYLLQEVIMSAFAMFMFKDQSMLMFQEKLQEEERTNNLSKLFNVENIPCENQIRNILDKVSPEVFDNIFHEAPDQDFIDKIINKHKNKMRKKKLNNII